MPIYSRRPMKPQKMLGVPTGPAGVSEPQSGEGNIEKFLNDLKSAGQVTPDRALAIAREAGMKDSAGYQAKQKVAFLLKKFGEKDDKGMWKITKDVKPPFFGQRTTEVAAKDVKIGGKYLLNPDNKDSEVSVEDFTDRTKKYVVVKAKDGVTLYMSPEDLSPIESEASGGGVPGPQMPLGAKSEVEKTDDEKLKALRELIRSKIKEVVRKKKGGGGYVLYSPNKGKKKAAKSVGSYPTRLSAKRAELARYPPKDPGRLNRLRKEIDKLLKDPKKRVEKERQAAKEKGTATAESFNIAVRMLESNELDQSKMELLTKSVISMVMSEGLAKRMVSQQTQMNESLFREEAVGSEWDDYISRVSDKVLSGDKKFSKLQKNIEKQTDSMLNDAFASISKAVKKKAKLKNMGIKKSESGKTYLPFSATFDNVAVGPIAIYVENGVPKIDVSDQAKAALTKTDPSKSKLFRAELVTVQEAVLDNMDDLTRAIATRDSYLKKMEDTVDKFVSGLSSLQVSLLKQLLVKKYRKLQ